MNDHLHPDRSPRSGTAGSPSPSAPPPGRRALALVSRFWAVLDARNKEFIRDRGALGWNIFFPVLVVLGFAFAFSGSNQDIFKAGLLKSSAGSTAFTETKYVQFVPIDDLGGALAKLKRHQLDFVLVVDGPEQGRYWMNTSSPKGYLLEKLLLGSVTASSGPKGFVREIVAGDEIRYVDWLVSGLLAMNMMFSALFGVGYTIVRYRKNGVLKRLKATPLGSFEFLLAQVVSRLILLVVFTSTVYVGCNLLVHVRMQGSYLDLAAVLVAGSMCLIALGLLVASRVKSEEFAGGLLNLISWPMMFLSGVWFSLEGAHPVVRKAAMAFPLTHVIDAARAIMTEGATLAQVAPNLGALLGMTLIFLAVGAWLFKWE